MLGQRTRLNRIRTETVKSKVCVEFACFHYAGLVLAYSQHAKTAATSSSTAQSISAVAVTTTTTPKVQTSRPTSVLPVGPTTTTLAQITVARTASTIAQTSIATSTRPIAQTSIAVSIIAQTSIAASIIAQTSRTASTIMPQSATVALTTTNLASIPATTTAVTSPRPVTNAGVPTTLRTNFVSTTNSISVTTTRISTTANAGQYDMFLSNCSDLIIIFLPEIDNNPSGDTKLRGLGCGMANLGRRLYRWQRCYRRQWH